MSALALEQLDPTFPARQRMSKLLNLPYVGSAKQLEFHLAPESGMNQPVLYGGAMGGGKAQPLTSLIQTPFGPIKMGEVKVGTQVCNPDGSYARIIQVHPRETKETYRVTFTDGTTCLVAEGHLWLGWIAMRNLKKNGKREPQGKRVYTTEQMKLIVDATKRPGKGGSFLIPVSEPVRYCKTYPHNPRPVDPYCLGVLLGDGSLGESGRLRFCTADPDISARFAARSGLSLLPPRMVETCAHYEIHDDTMSAGIEKLRLNGRHSWDKFIPESYLYASIESRWELLRGLMDTDGTVNDGKLYYTTVSEQLSNDVRTLVEGLGGVATITSRTPDGGRLAYTLYIKLPNPSRAFSLQRKAAKARAPQGMYRRVASVEPIGKTECQCITVDNPNGLYLTNHNIVTHNSAAICAEAIRECLEIPRNRVLMARLEAVNFKATTLVNLLQLMPNNVQHKPSTSMFVFPNGSLLMYTGLGTEKERQKLRSAEFGSIFIDEATQIDLQTFIEAGARLRWKPAADANRLKMRITCNPEPGWIKDDFVSNPKAGYRYISALPSDNPYLAAQYIQQMKEQLPTEWFQAYMLGDWDAMTPQTVVLPAYLLDEAMRRKALVDNSLDTIWSVDVARFGDDTTVVAKRQGLTFGVVDAWKKASITTTVNNIVTHYQIASVKPTAINVDDDGVGGGVTDGLRQAQANGLLGACLINPVIVQAQARDTTHYDRLKAELWFAFKALLESKAPVSLPAKPVEIKHDLESHRYDVRGGKAILEPKSIVKKRLGRSPDYGDAIILLMFERPGDYIAYDSPEDQVKRQLAKLPVEQRALYLANLERRRKAQQRIVQFQGRYGVQIYSGDDDGLGY